MIPRLLTALTLSLVISAPTPASPPLSTPQMVAEALKDSQLVARATVISRTEEWTADGEVVTREEALRINETGLRILKEVYPEAGLHRDPTPDEEEKADAFERSDEGRAYLSLSCRILVTLKFGTVLKGELPSPKSTTSCAWSTTPGLLCPHVMVDTDPGDQVTVFLSDRWDSRIVQNPESFLIGSGDLAVGR